MKPAVITLALIGFALRCPAQDTVSAALSKGIVEEDVNHNLEAAIKTYQSVLERFATDRTAAATALYRLAECYRKLGKTAEADAAYNRLIGQFPDQPSLVESSRRQRTRTMPPPPPPAATSTSQPEIEILKQKHQLALKQLAMTRHSMELGLESSAEVDQAQAAVWRAELNLLRQQAVGATGEPANRYRQQQRAILEQLIDVAQKSVAQAERQRDIGMASSKFVDQRKSELLDLQQELVRLGS